MISPQRVQGLPPDLLRDAILAHVPVAVIVHDRNLRIVCANEAFHQLTGHKDEMFGQSPFECISEPLLGALALKEKLPRVLDEGTVIGPEEIHSRNPDGRSLAFWHKSFPLSGADGTVAFAVTLLQDMTAHAVMPDEQYRTIIRTAIDGFWRLDVQGRLLDVNEAYCQMTGYSREELLTMRITDLEAVERREDMAHHIERIIKVGSDRFETLHRAKDGRFIDLEVSVTHLPFDEGHFICFLRDITTRKAMERQASRLERMAAMGQLLGGIAHELKNPLFILTGRLQLLRDKLAQREYGALETDLEKIEAAGQRMTSIAQRFLAFARPHQPTLTRCSVTAVLNDTLVFLGNELKKNRIQVTTSLTPDLPSVWADPRQLQEAFLNVMLNAMQAMVTAHGHGTLTVTTAFLPAGHPSSGEGDGGGWVEVRIQDDGPGIAQEHRSRVFEPFFTTKPSGQGTGLGLWIVRSTLMAMKGSITCETEVGQGTTFIVRLPVLSENTTGSLSGPNEGQKAYHDPDSPL